MKRTIELSPALRGTLFAVADGARTVRDVARAIDRAWSGTHENLCRLQRLGLVDWDGRRHGTLRLTQAGWAYVRPPEGFRFLPVA